MNADEQIREAEISKLMEELTNLYIEASGHLDTIKLAREIIKYQHDELLRMERENEWIPVSEREPENFGWYLVTMPGETPTTLYYGKSVSGRVGFTIMGELEYVSHWRPLPQPPEREK